MRQENPDLLELLVLVDREVSPVFLAKMANLVKMDNPALLVPLVQQDHEDFLECPVSLV